MGTEAPEGQAGKDEEVAELIFQLQRCHDQPASLPASGEYHVSTGRQHALAYRSHTPWATSWRLIHISHSALLHLQYYRSFPSFRDATNALQVQLQGLLSYCQVSHAMYVSGGDHASGGSCHGMRPWHAAMPCQRRLRQLLTPACVCLDPAEARCGRQQLGSPA